MKLVLTEKAREYFAKLAAPQSCTPPNVRWQHCYKGTKNAAKARVK